MTEDSRTLHIRQGFTYRVSFDWLTQAATPTAIPLTGHHASFSIVGRPGKFPAILTVTSESGQIEIEPGSVVGRVRVTLTAAQTKLLKRDSEYAMGVSPDPDDEPFEHVVSGPVALTKFGA